MTTADRPENSNPESALLLSLNQQIKECSDDKANLTTAEEIEIWMTAPAQEALKLQRPLRMVR